MEGNSIMQLCSDALRWKQTEGEGERERKTEEHDERATAYLGDESLEV